jgi:glycine betaine/proline transport system permease protein/glycine betaine/proline transport system substrate-binding protein
MMQRRRLIFLLLPVMALWGACSGKTGKSSDNTYANKEIIFADAGWDSIKLNNAVVGLIAETAFAYKGYRELSAGTVLLHEGLINGEVDVHMEIWVDNLSFYPVDLAAGKFQELGLNFDDNSQGIYVPRYVIEGDPERGITASAPGLRTVQDLSRYPRVFFDEEKPGRGRIYGAIPGWKADEILYNKYLYYQLDQQYEYFRPGSEAAMNAAISAAYEKGLPIAAYYWEPTWLLGKYDFVLLEDKPYVNDADLVAGKTAYSSTRVTIAVSNNFAEANADFCGFLRSYRTGSALLSEALAYMQETGADHRETARWLLKKHDKLLETWLTPALADLVRSAL